MRILVDVSQVIYKTGVSVYTKNLVENLLEIDKDDEYVLFGGYGRGKEELLKFFKGLSGNFTPKLFPLPPTLADILWNRFHKVSIENFTGNIDVYHSSDWAQAPADAFKVTTIHDLTPVKFPKLSPGRIVSVHKARLEWVAKEVDRVIVPSLSTKEDLMALGLTEKRIRVIPEGVEERFKPQPEKEVERVKRKYKITGDYLFSVGVGERKNTKLLIEAYERVKKGNLKLVLAGEVKGDYGVKRGVIFLGRDFDQEDLPALYSGASVMAYPSLYEGFGLPILEAFSVGTPVVTSNVSSLPEVAGNAAIFIDPYSLESLVEGIETALRNKISLGKKGLARAKHFSWQKTAGETLKVYREAA